VRSSGDWGSDWQAANLGAVALCEGDSAAARALADEALAGHRARGEPRGVALSLGVLGCAARSEGDPAEARRLLEEALAVHRTSRFVWGLATCIAALASVDLALGHLAAAEALCREGLEHSARLGERKGVAECLEAFAAVCVARQQMDRAARLFAAAEALRSEMGVPVPPYDRADYDRNLAAVRKALGRRTFSRAWEEGRAVSWEEAVQEALGASEEQ